MSIAAMPASHFMGVVNSQGHSSALPAPNHLKIISSIGLLHHLVPTCTQDEFVLVPAGSAAAEKAAAVTKGERGWARHVPARQNG
jgi:hypothetical protein